MLVIVALLPIEPYDPGGLISDLMILLVHAPDLFGINAALGIAASVMSAGVAGATFGRLVPVTAVPAFGVAMSCVAGSANAGVSATLGGWCFVALDGAARTEHLAPAVSPGPLTSDYVAVTLTFLGLAKSAASVRRTSILSWQ